MITQHNPGMYRAWINQPSTQQPLHHLSGVRCMVFDTGEPTVALYFPDGTLHSIVAPRECISRGPMPATH